LCGCLRLCPRSGSRLAARIRQTNDRESPVRRVVRLPPRQRPGKTFDLAGGGAPPAGPQRHLRPIAPRATKQWKATNQIVQAFRSPRAGQEVDPTIPRPSRGEREAGAAIERIILRKLGLRLAAKNDSMPSTRASPRARAATSGAATIPGEQRRRVSRGPPRPTDRVSRDASSARGGLFKGTAPPHVGRFLEFARFLESADPGDVLNLVSQPSGRLSFPGASFRVGFRMGKWPVNRLFSCPPGRPTRVVEPAVRWIVFSSEKKEGSVGPSSSRAPPLVRKPSAPRVRRLPRGRRSRFARRPFVALAECLRRTTFPKRFGVRPSDGPLSNAADVKEAPGQFCSRPRRPTTHFQRRRTKSTTAEPRTPPGPGRGRRQGPLAHRENRIPESKPTETEVKSANTCQVDPRARHRWRLTGGWRRTRNNKRGPSSEGASARRDGAAISPPRSARA